MSETLSYKLKKINKQIAIEVRLKDKSLAIIKRIDELSTLYKQSQKDYRMSDENKTKYSKFKDYKGEPIIEFDEVMNNPDLTANEFTITVDQVSGKVWIASEAVESQVILQGVIAGYIDKNQDKEVGCPPGAEFNYVDLCKTVKDKQTYEGYKAASFTGSIFFQNLPVEVLTPKFAEPLEKDKAVITDGKEVEEVKEVKEVKVDEEIDIKLPSYETLCGVPKGQLKPPRGISRTTRSRFNKAMRDKYPAAFDKGGNWIGFETEYVKTQPEAEMKDDSEVEVDTTEVPDRMIVGKDNLLTTATDARMPGSWFIGRFYEGRGVAIVSTNEDKFDNSAWFICNKEKTAIFVLAGLRKNPGYSKMVDGCEIYSVNVLKKDYLTKKGIPVYYISNAVTALQSLGTRESDIATIKNRTN